MRRRWSNRSWRSNPKIGKRLAGLSLDQLPAVPREIESRSTSQLRLRESSLNDVEGIDDGA